jgi:hypothetical protein
MIGSMPFVLAIGNWQIHRLAVQVIVAAEDF